MCKRTLNTYSTMVLIQIDNWYMKTRWCSGWWRELQRLSRLMPPRESFNAQSNMCTATILGIEIPNLCPSLTGGRCSNGGRYRQVVVSSRLTVQSNQSLWPPPSVLPPLWSPFLDICNKNDLWKATQGWLLFTGLTVHVFPKMRYFFFNLQKLFTSKS